VLAGTNGAGKSSVAGAMFRQAGADYFNPNEATARILAANTDISTAEANSAAWPEGKGLLERAIAERLDFAFETTLGGHTIRALLHEALAAGIEVRMWFVGLSSPELHSPRPIQGGSRRTRHSGKKDSGALRPESDQSD
jgi:predicted ABC-type ATPase